MIDGGEPLADGSVGKTLVRSPKDMMIEDIPVGAMASLELGRAFAMAGDRNRAEAAYQSFFALWKDADIGIPILMQAKADYARLKLRIDRLP